MTETETRSRRADKQQQRNGDAATEQAASSTTAAAAADDVFDDTYREKEGPKPPTTLVWRNIVLMSLLHAGALYGLVVLPRASGFTLAWSHSQRTECADVV
ncbi:hypothetical protein F2P81_026333 [Scophthalmus maximus]|uniref:Uncharacterized protein n=1 Tax=Scophthalmus maximus TaxID=52904 RepID=A0A6A4RS14_SCOMX|nr:hypothetical protein F2P81_026333 [Scophthalmus maximus]